MFQSAKLREPAQAVEFELQHVQRLAMQPLDNMDGFVISSHGNLS